MMPFITYRYTCRDFSNAIDRCESVTPHILNAIYFFCVIYILAYKNKIVFNFVSNVAIASVWLAT